MAAGPESRKGVEALVDDDALAPVGPFLAEHRASGVPPALDESTADQLAEMASLLLATALVRTVSARRDRQSRAP